MIHVMDACALIAFLRDEEGADIVDALFANPADDCIVHAVNLCEVYYDFLHVTDEETASSAIADLLALGLLVCEDMDVAFWRTAGQLKATQRLSLVDCFAVALTLRLDAILVTSDHHEFDVIASQGVCSIQFFR